MNKEIKVQVLAVRANGVITDLKNAPKSVSGEQITSQMPEGLEIIRHSTSHIMADAVKRLFPNAKLAIGPSIKTGFYYDFDVDKPFTPEDLLKIEKEMTRKANLYTSASSLTG